MKKIIKKNLNNNKGFSLIEIMISSLLMIFLFFGVIRFTVNMNQQLYNHSGKLGLKENVKNLFFSIEDNASEYQMYYSCVVSSDTVPVQSGCVTEDSLLSYNQLSFTLNGEDQLIPVAECPLCEYRLGYVLYSAGVGSVLKLVVSSANASGKIFSLSGYVNTGN